jgi:hypothetical protein
MGPVVEGTCPNHHHPQYGQYAWPASGGGTIDGRDIEHHASYCINMDASTVVPEQLKTSGESNARDSGGGCEKKTVVLGEEVDGSIGGGDSKKKKKQENRGKAEEDFLG